MTRRLAAWRRGWRLLSDTSGLALLEFAFSLPIFLGIGMYAIEMASLALAHLRVSQAALNLSDNASRVGVQNQLAVQQLREVDINDVLDGLRTQTKGWGLTTGGRVTLSSLEDRSGTQIIHWQRCIGLKSGAGYASSYGASSITDGTDQTDANNGWPTTGNAGMGDAGSKVTAPPNSGVMFVEINFDYKPVVSSRWLPNGAEKIHYIASFIVRDRRDFAQIFNPDPAAPRLTCDKFTT